VRIAANGVVSALNTVDIRPQVTSTVAKVHIKEGQFVRAGDLLFTLDSRTDEVNLAKALAQLDKDLATLADNQRQLARSKELLAKNSWHRVRSIRVRPWLMRSRPSSLPTRQPLPLLASR
jgi:multidrug efflux pump subunit AcrA (membrane-fusion protein)